MRWLPRAAGSCSASCTTSTTGSTTAIAPNCYVQDLFTSEASRGKGVGGALINGVYDRAKAAGSGRVYWLTHETNHTAMQLYDKIGERSGFVVYRKLF